jgi:hypothetical protein
MISVQFLVQVLSCLKGLFELWKANDWAQLSGRLAREWATVRPWFQWGWKGVKANLSLATVAIVISLLLWRGYPIQEVCWVTAIFDPYLQAGGEGGQGNGVPAAAGLPNAVPPPWLAARSN